jgi:predicted secreted hydrolase
MEWTVGAQHISRPGRTGGLVTRAKGGWALAIASALALLGGLATGATPAAAAGGSPSAAEPATGAPSAAAPSPVLPGSVLEFPRDFGSHPTYGIEWWYVTGWLRTAAGQPLGFEVTLFRVRPPNVEPNPSAFTPSQLLIGHCVISDPQRGRPWQAQRIRRAGFGLAEARTGDTDVWIDDWHLQRHEGRYQADIDAGSNGPDSGADRFGLHLTLAPSIEPMLNGINGYSRKGPDPLSASEYYSLPHLRVTGSVMRDDGTEAITGEAWLDHEWSSRYLDPNAAGWDWVGLNLDDGGALMAFRIRGRDGSAYWAGGTELGATGAPRALEPRDIRFVPGRLWHSARSGVDYPVSWELQLPGRTLELTPLMDDQEIDARASSRALYWEGAVSALQAGHPIGRGYLELTGYGQPLSLP